MSITIGIVCIFAQNQVKHSLVEDFTTSYKESVLPSSQYRETMREASTGYIRDVIENKYPDKQDLVNEIKNNTTLNARNIPEVVDELYERADKYHKVYFKWYMLIGALLSGLLVFYAPLWMLLYQVSIMQMSMEDEVVQFHTLVMILMYVDGMTLDVILEWMERFAFCFKNSISECILDLQHSERRALENMKDSEPFPPFKRFCDNLMAIDNVGVVSAFDEIVAEKEYYKKKREEDNLENTEKKSNLGKLMAFVPIFSAIFGYMIFPFMSLAFEMLKTMKGVLT